VLSGEGSPPGRRRVARFIFAALPADFSAWPFMERRNWIEETHMQSERSLDRDDGEAR